MDSGGGGGAAEEGRRGADCVYYLASPLTCTKGSECEYRHSDAARANPRDCWYWFNGNCANPKCSFRHPPLDDVLGAPATPRASSQQSAPQVPAPGQAPAVGAAAKPGVPCYYFQKGMCAKGNLCAFSHVPQFAGSPALHQSAKVFAPHLQPKNPNSWVKPANSAQQNTAPAVHDELKGVSARNGKPAQRQNPTSRAYQSSGVYQNHSNSYVLSGAAKGGYQPQPSVEDDTAETGEFVREPSAGSSVVAGSVEDDAERSFKEVRNSYRRTSGEQNTGMSRPTQGGYELERSHRSSSDRLLSSERSLSSQREPVPVTANSSDLRHRLLKQRRLNDPRSTQVPDSRHDRRYPDDEHDSHHRHRRGEERASHDSASRSRLHGRIKLPGETSLDRPGPYSEKERRPRDRVSPPRQTDLRSKIHDRLKARSNEDVPGNNLVKSSVVKASSSDDAVVVNFSGPKSLAELRAKKFAANSSVEHITKNADRTARPVHMTSEIVTNRVSPDPVPFDSPKPLSAILKRKREAASADSGSVQEESIAGEQEQSLTDSILEDGRVVTNTEDNEEEEAFHPEDEVMYDDSLSPANDNAAEPAADTGKEELEEGEQQEDLETAEEEYEYEAADEVNAEEDNDYQEYEDDDDLEDDDDFARKVGVLIS